jgi:hypothetical protein
MTDDERKVIGVKAGTAASQEIMRRGASRPRSALEMLGIKAVCVNLEHRKTTVRYQI